MQPLRRILNNKKIPELGRGNFEGLPVRPSKKNTRLFIDNEYFEKGYARLFSKSVLAVYCVLAKYANYQTQTCFPSIDIIMREGSIKRRNTVIIVIRTTSDKMEFHLRTVQSSVLHNSNSLKRFENSTLLYPSIHLPPSQILMKVPFSSFSK